MVIISSPRLNDTMRLEFVVVSSNSFEISSSNTEKAEAVSTFLVGFGFVVVIISRFGPSVPHLL